MWHRLVPPHLARQISAGASLLRETPGLRSLLGGALAPWVITLILHPHGQALVALRLALIVGAVLLYLALTGEVARLRRDVRRMRALLRSTAPRAGRPASSEAPPDDRAAQGDAGAPVAL